MTRTLTTTTLLVLALLAPLALAPSPATANTYDVYSCWAGYGTFRNPSVSSTAWSKIGSPGHYVAADDCGSNSSSGSISIVSCCNDPEPNGAFGELRFSVPSGASVARVRLWRMAWSYGSGSGGGSSRNYAAVLTAENGFFPDADGGSDVAVGTAGSGDTTQHGIVDSNLWDRDLLFKGSSFVAYRVGCGFASGCPVGDARGPAPNGFAAGVEIFGSIVTISDTVAPTIEVADTELFGGTPAAGDQRILVSSATDLSGIKRIGAYADGETTPVGVVDYEQDQNWCQWWKPAPCQNVTNVEIPVDTRQLSDGEHSFVVKAYDAAGNERASTTHVVTIANGGAASGGGAPNGVGAGPGARLNVVFARNNKSRARVGYRSSVTIRGALRNSGGGPIGGAQVEYGILAARVGAQWQDLGSVRTDDQGDFTLKVPAKLGSRRLRFSYRPQLGGPVAVTSEVRLGVRAPVKLKVAPRHVRNRQSITFRGKLPGAPIPRRGKLVDMQVVIDGRWHTFATLRTSRTGGFRYRYTFKRTYTRVTYRFRALSRRESTYPFAAGHSKRFRVHVN